MSGLCTETNPLPQFCDFDDNDNSNSRGQIELEMLQYLRDQKGNLAMLRKFLDSQESIYQIHYIFGILSSSGENVFSSNFY